MTFIIDFKTGTTSRPAGNLENKKHLLQQYLVCFGGVGRLQEEFCIPLNPTVVLAVHPPHCVPEALREPLTKEHDCLVAQKLLFYQRHWTIV